jgi:hypothetical protein
MVAYDRSRAQSLMGGALLAPRTDIPDSERCYVAIHPGDHERPIRGFIQVFKNGSVGYWLEPMQQAKDAATMEVAMARLLDFHPGGISGTFAVGQEQSHRQRPKT